MGDISKNFNRSEMSCKCRCGFETADIELIEVLEVVRDWCEGAPVRITSGCRCATYNKQIGGSEHSKHKLGIAADIIVHGVEPKEVYNILDGQYPSKFGIGSYKTFTHIDVRPSKARWDG